MKPQKWIVLAISIFLMFFNPLFPPILGLNQIGTSVVFIFIGTLLLLMFVNLAMPLFMAILAYAVCGVFTLDQAITLSLGNHVTWLVLMAGLLISVLDECGVIKRIAIYFLSLPIVRKSPWMFVGTLFLFTLMIGSVMDPTALMVVMVVLTEEILVTLGLKKGDRVGEFIMLSVMVFVGLSYGTTPIGHPVPVTMMAIFEEVVPMNFLQYSIPGYITHLVFFVLFMLAMRYIFRIDVSSIKNPDLTAIQESLPPIDRKAKISAITYGVVIVLWLAPNLLQGVLPDVASFLKGLGNNGPLIAGVIVMSIVHVNGKPVMDIVRQIKVGAPWMACIPVAAALLLGSSLNTSGFSFNEFASQAAAPYLANMSPYAFVFIICILAGFFTQLSSSMVVATIFSTVSVAMIKSGAIPGVNAGALCFCICSITAIAYIIPPSSSQAALIAGGGWVRPQKQLLEGGFFAILGILLVATLGYYIGCLVF